MRRGVALWLAATLVAAGCSDDGPRAAEPTETTAPTTTTTVLGPVSAGSVRSAATLTTASTTTTVALGGTTTVEMNAQAGCPVLRFESLPHGGHLAVTMGASLDYFAADGDLVIFQGETGALVDGYQTLESADERGEVRMIEVSRPDCQAIELVFVGVSDTDIDETLAVVEIDDSELTDVNEWLSFTDGSIFGRGLLERVDADPFVAAVSDVFGAPDSDTGWIAVPTDFPCLENGEYRSVFWGDLRVVFERSSNDERITAWSVGDQSLPLLAPNDPFRPVESLGLGSQGLQLGDPVSVLDQFELVFEEDGGYFTVGGVIGRSVRADRGSITAFAVGRLDCTP